MLLVNLETSLQGTSDEYHNIFLMEKYEKYQYFSVESRTLSGGVIVILSFAELAG